MSELSVVIITFNEEKNIARCLESVKEIADEIVVLDSFSADKTEEICRNYPVKFIQRKWDGYSESKNFANKQAKHNWILSLDADEALSEELKESIEKIDLNSTMTAYEFNRLSNYCGKWIHHSGWYPDTKVRIFNRMRVQWAGEIHEKLVGVDEKKIGFLRGDLFHYSYYSIEEHLKKAEHFSTLSAKAYFQKGRNFSLLKLLINPTYKFIRNYFFKLGFLDGRAGFTICRIMAYETFLKYKKLRKLKSHSI